MADRDIQSFLTSLLVTDRECLAFLFQTVVGQQRIESPEQMVMELTSHVQNHGGRTPSGLVHWLKAPSAIQGRYLARVIRLAGFYRDLATADHLKNILQQLTFVALHPACVTALASIMGVKASAVLTEILWAAPPHQWHVRETAILRELGNLGWTSSIDHLVRALGVPYDNPSRAAAGALARFPADEVLPRLVSVLDGTTNPRQAAGAAEALGLLGDSRAIVGLQRACNSSNPNVTCAAAVALARLGDTNAEGRLVSLARVDQGHSGAEMRARAFAALGVLGKQEGKVEPTTRATLLRGVSDSQPEVRSAAANALGSVGRGDAAKTLCAALNKEVSPLVRTEMIKALGRLGHSLTVPVLLEFLRTDSIPVKIEVLNALGCFPDPRLAQHISPYRRSHHPGLVDAANRALRRLLHKPFTWPRKAALKQEVRIPLFNLRDARNLLLPPPPPPSPAGFFERLFGSGPEEKPSDQPDPIGELVLNPDGARLDVDNKTTSIRWEQRFSVQISREPIEAKSESEDDIGVHFTLRQRVDGLALAYETIALSLWCAPSEEVGRFVAKSERLPCLDPHTAARFLSALRYYTEVLGEPIV